MLKVIPQLSGAGHRLALRDPLLQILHFPIELEEPVLLLQLGLPLLHHILQRHVKPVYVGLLLGDLLTVQERGAETEDLASNIVNATERNC